MDTLYAASGSTSLVAAILLEECEHPYTLELMALYPDGAGDKQFAQVNPWRQVPALVTAQGMLTEVIAIAHYLDGAQPERRLLPHDPWQHAQALRWYSCLSTGLAPYVRCVVRPERFVGDADEPVRNLRAHVARLLVEKLALLNDELANRSWFVGEEFGPADALLVTVVGWVERMRIRLDALSHLNAHRERCLDRSAVQRAIERHGVVPNIVQVRGAA